MNCILLCIVNKVVLVISNVKIIILVYFVRFYNGIE